MKTLKTRATSALLGMTLLVSGLVGLGATNTAQAAGCETQDPRRVASGGMVPMAIPICPPEGEEPPEPALGSFLYEQSVPETMLPGRTYPVTMRFSNTASMTWDTARFFLGSQSPQDTMRWGINRVSLPHAVVNAQQVTFQFNVTAPTQPGTYDFQWQMLLHGIQWFGNKTPLKRITVLPSTVTGAVDGISGGDLVGWACATYEEAPIDVNVYVGRSANLGGSWVATARANLPAEASLAGACGTQNSARRFRIPITSAMIANYLFEPFYVHGLAPAGGTNALLGGSGNHHVPQNQPPSLNLTSPANGLIIGEGTPVSFSATASDADDGIAAVSFFTGNTLIASTSPPNHAYTWRPAPGDHVVRAMASDTRGEGTYSDTRSIHVSKVTGRVNEVRDGRIIGWACSTKVADPIEVHLYVGGGWPDGQYVQKVTANLGSSATVQAACGAGTAHSFSFSPSAAALQAHAGKKVYVHGISALTGPSNLLPGSGNLTLQANRAPQVTVTSPSAGAQLNQPGSFLFTANATDPDGLVNKVQLLVNGSVKATLTAAPYQVQVSGLGVGNHVLRAVATDTSGATGSHEITVTVAQGQAPTSVSRQYVYDAQQRLCKVIEPETGSTVMSYDAAGNLVWSASGLNLPSTSQCDLAAAQSSGRRVDRVYDSRNRLAQLRFPDRNGDQDWEYTAEGLPSRVVTWNDGGASTVTNTYAYNKRGMLTSESASVDAGTALTVGYAYNGIGAVSSQTRPGNVTLTYTPNALGQPTRIAQSGQVYAQAITYHPNGALASLQYGNGVVHQTTLNERQLPSRLSDGNISSLEYQYDHNANTTAILDLVQGAGRNVQMQYDARDRLVQATSPGFGGDGQHRYRYDVLDNLISSHLGGVKEHNYWYDARNRLTNVRNDQGDATIGLNYDVQGNLATRNGVAHSFDYGNRLRSVNGVERYRYDAHGRRVAAIDGQGTRVDSLYGSTGTLLYENRRDGGGATHYVHLGKRLLAMRKGNTTTWQHVDALGTPVATSNASGALVERKQYTPYGGSIGAATDGVGYTGHVMDAATGLTYMQQRYMDPELGMFLSVDPVTAYKGNNRYFNRYWYAAGNPYKFIDPDGRKLEIQGNREFKREIKSQIKELKATPTGRQIVAALKKSKETFTIRESSERSTATPNNLVDAQNGQGTGGTIAHNPQWSPIINTSEGKVPAPPKVVLGHELAHALDFSMGTLDSSINPSTRVPRAEENATDVENQIRREMKLPERSEY